MKFDIMTKNELINELKNAKYIILQHIFNVEDTNIELYSAHTEIGQFIIDKELFDEIKDLKNVKQIIEEDYNNI